MHSPLISFLRIIRDERRSKSTNTSLGNSERLSDLPRRHHRLHHRRRRDPVCGVFPTFLTDFVVVSRWIRAGRLPWSPIEAV
jgi:hypothetical protein